MKKKGYGRRILAGVMSLAIVLSNQSFAVLAEEIILDENASVEEVQLSFDDTVIEPVQGNTVLLEEENNDNDVTVPEDAGIVEEASNDSGLSIIKETELETVGSADELLTEEAENSDLPDTQNNADEGKGNEASIADLNLPDEGLQITYIEEVEEATGMQKYGSGAAEEQEQYEAEILGLSGTDKILPGGTINLRVHVWENKTDENGNPYGQDIDVSDIKWEFKSDTSPDEGDFPESPLTLDVDENDPSVCRVKANENERLIGTEYTLLATATVSEDTSVTAGFKVYITDSYYFLDFKLDNKNKAQWKNLEPGNSIKIVPHLMYKTLSDSNEIDTVEVTKGVSYNLAHQSDENVLQIDENTDGSFLITKLENAYARAELTATWSDSDIEEGSEEAEPIDCVIFEFNKVDYNIEFEQDNYEVFTDGSVEIQLAENCPDFDDYDADIVWKIGRYIDEEGTFVTYKNLSELLKNESIQEKSYYGISLVKNKINIVGSKLLTEGSPILEEQGFCIRAEATAPNDEIQWIANVWVSVREPEYNYQYPSYGIAQLPGWRFGINKEFCCEVKNAVHPNGEDMSVFIKDINVVMDEGLSPYTVTAVPWDDGNGWDICSNKPGHAIVTLTYEPIEGSDDAGAHKFDVWVGGDVYNIDVTSSGEIEDVLPGASIDLTASVWHDGIDENGEYYGKVADDVVLEWTYSEEGKDVLECKQDGQDQNVYHITVDKGAEDRDIQIMVRAYLLDEYGGYVSDEIGNPVEVSYGEFWVRIRQKYYKLEPFELQRDLPVGDTIKVEPILYDYQKEATAGKETCSEVKENIQYRWEWNSEAIQITDADGNVLTNEIVDESGAVKTEGCTYGSAPFTVKRLRNSGEDFRLIAELPDENGDYQEVTRSNYRFDEQDYSIWFAETRGDGYSWIYSDETSMELSLDTEKLMSVNGYKIDWIVGICDEEGNINDPFAEATSENTEGVYSVSEDCKTICLNGESINSIFMENQDKWFEVCAVVTIGEGEQKTELARTQIGIEVRDSEYNYSFGIDEDHTLMPGDSIWISENADYYERSAEYPHGEEWHNVQVLDVSVKIDENDPQKAISCKHYDFDEDSGWEISAKNTCNAKVTIKYETIKNEVTQQEFQLHVVGNLYFINLDLDADYIALMPEDEITLNAAVGHAQTGEDYIEDDGDIVLKWGTEDEELLKISPEYDSSDRTYTVQARGQTGNTQIWMKAYYINEDNEEEEVASTEVWVDISDFQIKEYINDACGYGSTSQIQYLDYGQTFQVQPVLYQNGTPYQDEIRYHWEYDDSNLEISPEVVDEYVISENDVLSFAFKRRGNDWTDASLIAELPNDDGSYREVARREWHFRTYDSNQFRISGTRGDRYTWIYSDEKSMNLDVDAGEGVLANGRYVEWVVGAEDDKENIFEIEGCLPEDKTGNTYLDGSAIAEWLNTNPEKKDDLVIEAKVKMEVLGENEKLETVTVASDKIGFELREASIRWEDDESEELILGGSFYYDNSVTHKYVEDQLNPYEEEIEYTITGITSNNEEVLKPVYDENSCSWRVEAVGIGTATICYDVVDSSGNKDSFERTKEVIGNRYIAWTNRSTGRENLLRGDKQILETLVYYQEVTKDENGDLIYSSTQLTPDKDYTVSYENQNPEIITVSKDGHVVPSENEYGDAWIKVCITVYPEEEDPFELPLQWEHVCVTDAMYVLEVEEAYDTGRNEAITITPQVIWYGEEGEPSELENVTFTVEEVSDNPILDIKGNDRGEFTISAKDGIDDKNLHSTIRIVASAERDDYGYPFDQDAYSEIYLCNHEELENKWNVMAWPGCTTSGVKVKFCAECGYAVEKETLDALGHIWGEWTVLQKATCIVQGEKEHTCDRCGLEETEDIPILGHTAGGWNVSKKATCTESGSKYQICTECSTVLKTENIPALGHKSSGWIVAKAATCTEPGAEYQICNVCSTNIITREIQAKGHNWSSWQVVSPATVFASEVQQRVCGTCGAVEQNTVGSRLASTMTLNASSLVLKVKQSTTKLTVTGMALGDSLASVTSSNTKVLKVSNVKANGTFKLTAQNKTGSADLVIKLASGHMKKIRVTVQKAAVKTTKISGVLNKITLKRGEKTTLKPVITPITSLEKVTYSTSNKKVVTVSSRGAVVAKASGTAKITVKSGSKKFTIKVTVLKTPPTKISGIPSAKTLKKGKTLTLKPKLLPSGSEAKITYKSSNTKVATVTSKGKITAKKAGKATITVKAGSVTAQCVITVK